MKVVQFGAGNIGRGFLGQLYFESGYETVFVDIDEELVARLNERRQYPLRLVDTDGHVQDLTIDRVRAVSAADQAAVAGEMASADFVATSVGASALSQTAPSIAQGLRQREELTQEPLNILLCENLPHAAAHMRDCLMAQAPFRETSADRVGLIEMVVGRIVPKPTDALRTEDPLLIVTEPYVQLQAARSSFVGAIPPLAGLLPVEPFDAYFAYKLFTLNTAHAVLAYLGYPRHEYIWQCAGDGDIHRQCVAALEESCRALVAEYGFPAAEQDAHIQQLMRRFANEALSDTVARVAADPLRKLAPGDRLVGAAQLAEKHGIQPVALARAIEAALAYDNPADKAALALQQRLREQGRVRFLSEYCKIAPSSLIAKLLQDYGAKGTRR